MYMIYYVSRHSGDADNSLAEFGIPRDNIINNIVHIIRTLPSLQWLVKM